MQKVYFHTLLSKMILLKITHFEAHRKALKVSKKLCKSKNWRIIFKLLVKFYNELYYKVIY